jgi:hypothetical protein
LAFKKKLYQYHPQREIAHVDTYRTKHKIQVEPADPASLERGVRQLLADKISGDMVGLWLLVPEHLRLGTWDLLGRWSGQATPRVEPRLALQLVHEAALCVTGIRQSRCLSQKGFELLNGLPFVATDQAMHDVLEAHTVAEAEALQKALGWLRRARGHFRGQLLAIDPHRLRSYSKRQMCRYRGHETSRPFKVAQTFFCLDVDTHQPLGFTSATSALSVTQATPQLLGLAADILNPQQPRPLVRADTEHYTSALFDHVCQNTPFDLLVPMPNHRSQLKILQQIPAHQFQPQWAGLATTQVPYTLKNSQTPLFQLVQRVGEKPDDYQFKAFLATRHPSPVEDLTLHFPKRWHVEEFFNAHQALGWNRAGTLNLNLRYGPMSMALIAQAVLHQFRQRLGEPYSGWDASHLARAVFNGIDGDIRVQQDTIVVTFYNAPNSHQLRQHYQHLPEKLEQEHIDPRIPWLYHYKLDFRFK